ncbi:MAG: alpha/beta hydrolase [Bacteroidota bacterium]
MKVKQILFFTLINLSLLAQTKTTIYCFPGQGSDQRIFDSILFNPQYSVKFIDYGTPEKGMKMSDFAKKLSKQIDTTEQFYLIGVSLGGMICCELAEIINPEKTILISSAKNRNELPFRYKFQKVIPLYKLFPGSVLLAGAKFLQPIVEPDRKKNKKTFKAMLKAKNARYMKRTVALIINWDRKNNSKNVIHIHGNNDHTLPIRKIKSVNYSVKNGSHMMTLTKANEINVILNSILND